MKTTLIVLAVVCVVLAALYFLGRRDTPEAVGQTMAEPEAGPVVVLDDGIQIEPAYSGVESAPDGTTREFLFTADDPTPRYIDPAPVAPRYVFACRGVKCADGVATWIWGTYEVNVTAQSGPRRDCEDTLAEGGACDLRAYEPDPDGCYCAPEEVRE
jgi:hypothetical protein